MAKVFFIYDEKEGDIFTDILDVTSENEAVKQADAAWMQLSDYDKKCRTGFSLCWIEESDIDEDETIHLENGFDVVKTYKEER